MERLHSDATFDTGAAGSSDSMSGRSIKAVLVKLYPYIHFMWEVSGSIMVGGTLFPIMVGGTLFPMMVGGTLFPMMWEVHCSL